MAAPYLLALLCESLSFVSSLATMMGVIDLLLSILSSSSDLVVVVVVVLFSSIFSVAAAGLWQLMSNKIPANDQKFNTIHFIYWFV
jgi:hypothetical protein